MTAEIFIVDLAYTQSGHKLRFFKSGKAQFVTVGIIYFVIKPFQIVLVKLLMYNHTHA